MKRGVLTVESLKARCIVDATTHCWLWTGARSGRSPAPRIWTLDHARLEKRVMSGPLAAWNIAYGAPPRPGRLAPAGVTNKALCCMHGVGRTAVSRIRSGQSHKSVV